MSNVLIIASLLSHFARWSFYSIQVRARCSGRGRHTDDCPLSTVHWP